MCGRSQCFISKAKQPGEHSGHTQQTKKTNDNDRNNHFINNLLHVRFFSLKNKNLPPRSFTCWTILCANLILSFVSLHDLYCFPYLLTKFRKYKFPGEFAIDGPRPNNTVVVGEVPSTVRLESNLSSED